MQDGPQLHNDLNDSRLGFVATKVAESKKDIRMDFVVERPEKEAMIIYYCAVCHYYSGLQIIQ